ncbi:MAG: hypothetical protein AAGI30_08785 [Planctomycetota bacterium]
MTDESRTSGREPLGTDEQRDAEVLGARVESLEAELEVARAEANAAARRHAVDLELMRAEAIDVETARILAEHAMDSAGDGAEVESVVSELRRTKPFLFRGGAPSDRGHSAAMAGRARRDESTRSSTARAAAAGDRGALLQYLRARRAS